MKWISTIVLVFLFAFPLAFGSSINSETSTHTVFAELAVASYCSSCPIASDTIFSLYTAHDPPFYYVSMVDDKNNRAYDRLHNDYNLSKYPTVFFDGGKGVLALTADENSYKQAIEECGQRPVPGLNMDVFAEYVDTCPDCEGEILVEIQVMNNEDETYEGRIRAYITEIVSRWRNYEGRPYHFGFLDYAIDTNVSIGAGQSISLRNLWIASNEGYDDITEEDMGNIMIMAVVFNAEKHQGYAYPPDDNPFDAYYADYTQVYRVREDNLPPEVGLVTPKDGYLYIFDRLIMETPGKNTVLIGRTTVNVYASDDSLIERVELYVDEDLKQTFTSEPYQWLLDETLFGRHTLRVTAYDNAGKSSSDEQNIWIFNL